MSSDACVFAFKPVDFIECAILEKFGEKYGMCTDHKQEADGVSQVDFVCNQYGVSVLHDPQAPSYCFHYHLDGAHRQCCSADTMWELMATMESEFQADKEFPDAAFE